MSIFNKKQNKALLSKKYICNECGELMEFEDEWEDILICPKCGHTIETDDYGFEDGDDEDYEEYYPTKEEVLGIVSEDDEIDEDNPYGETYDEVCGELDDD